MTGVGAVAAGGAQTAAAAAEVLRAGGNAVDAVVAAGFAAAVAEPALASLGGGGFLLSAPPDGPERLLDFFVDAPGRGRAPGPAPQPLPVTVRFAGADQVFATGWAAVAVPGCLDGWLHASRTLGRLPLAQVVAPAARLARDGAVLDEAQAALLVLLRDVLLLTDDGRALFAPGGRLLRAGERLRNPLLADVLDDVGRGSLTGASLGEALQDAADRAGALVGAEDTAAYQVHERAPLRARYRDAEVVTNAPPSFGGALVLAALEELAAGSRLDRSPGSAVRLADALTAMSERHLAQAVAGGTVPISVRGTVPISVRGTVPISVRGTTHVSVLDHDGGLAAMTLSNGSCSGVFVPGTGVQLNNVMGEADLHPGGSPSAPPGTRIGSMMAPTLLRTADGTRTALGSGGSERIRSALLCTLSSLVDRGAALEDAVRAPRLHWDRRALQVEPGLGDDVLAALAQSREHVREWAAPDLYFGGVHAVSRAADGTVRAVGDTRRAGVGLVVPPD